MRVAASAAVGPWIEYPFLAAWAVGRSLERAGLFLSSSSSSPSSASPSSSLSLPSAGTEEEEKGESKRGNANSETESAAPPCPASASSIPNFALLIKVGSGGSLFPPCLLPPFVYGQITSLAFCLVDATTLYYFLSPSPPSLLSLGERFRSRRLQRVLFLFLLTSRALFAAALPEARAPCQ